MTTPTAAPPRPVHAAAEDAHRSIRELISRLEAPCEPTSARDLLERLHVLLVEHFAEEEGDDGLYAQLRTARPGFDGRLKSLQREHRQFLDSLEGILEGHGELARLMASLREKTVSLVHQLAAHERTETRMTMDAFLVDLGEGD